MKQKNVKFGALFSSTYNIIQQQSALQVKIQKMVQEKE